MSCPIFSALIEAFQTDGQSSESHIKGSGYAHSWPYQQSCKHQIQNTVTHGKLIRFVQLILY